MSMNDAINMVRRWIQRPSVKRGETEKSDNPLDAGPDPFLADDDMPTGKAIVCGKGNDSKGDPANAANRKNSEVALEYKKATNDEKGIITARVVEEMSAEGYTINNNEWKQMLTKNVMKKVRKPVLDFEKP
jgi:hypothetical protein